MILWQLLGNLMADYGWLLVAGGAGLYAGRLRIKAFIDSLPMPTPSPKPKPEPNMPDDDEEKDERIAAFETLLMLKDKAPSLIPDAALREAALKGLEAYVTGMFKEKDK